MIIVPVSGDNIKSSDGLPSKVLSYTNYEEHGPAVIVETGSGASETLAFEDIVSVNGKSVKVVIDGTGYKVLESAGFVERKFQLPQIGEIVTSAISEIETRRYEVSRIRLHVPQGLSRGLVLDVNDVDSEEKVELTLDDIIDIEQYLFDKKKFLEFYQDYRPKGTA